MENESSFIYAVRMPRPRVASKEAITEAALAVFRERGYEGTTIPAIAERLGVSPGTLYNYYPSKEKLLFACARAGGTPGAIFTQLRTRIGERPVEDLLVEAAGGVARFLELRMPALLIRGARPLAADRPGVDFPRRGLEAARAYFADEVGAGRLAGDPDTMTWSFLGGLFYRAFFTRLYGLPRSFDGDPARFARTWAEAFRVPEAVAG